MANVLDIIVRAEDQASSIIEGVGDAGARAGELIDEHWGHATLALGAAGAGIEGLARSQQDNTVTTRNLAAALDMTEDEVRGLATGMSNATFPLDEVLSLMETGRQRGLTSAEQLQKYAETWDMVGDASGENGAELGRQAVALEAIGIGAAESDEALAALGYVTRETTGGVGEFLQFIERTGPEMREMGMDVNDAAAVLGVLEKEFGMTGRVARSEFRSAVNDADGDLHTMLDTLGISQDTLADYQGAVADSSDVIAEQADIYADSRTSMQGYQSRLEDLMFEHGALFESASALAPALIAVGPATKGVSMAMRGASAAFGLAGKAFMKMSAIVMANPWVLIIAGVVALVALIITNWDTIVEFLTGVWEWIKDAGAAVWEWLQDKVGAALDFIWQLFLNWSLPGLIIKHWDTIKRVFSAALDFVTGLIGGAASWISDRVTAIVGFFREIPGRIRSALSTLFDIVTWPYRTAFGFVSDRIRDAKGWFSDIPGHISSVFSGLFNIITWPFRTAFNAVAGFWNSTLGRIGFTVPSWVPAIGGNEWRIPQIPTLHSGGRFRAPTPGGEGLAILRDEEHVLTPEQARRGGGGDRPPPVLVQLLLDGKVAAEALADPLEDKWAGQTRRGKTLAFQP